MWRQISAALVLVFTATAASADRGLLGGALGRWLDLEAGPQLIDKLANHPKFKHSRLSFRTLQHGVLVPDHELSVAVQRHLTHQILRAGRNDVTFQQPRTQCPAVRETGYAIAIEVSRQGRSQHYLQLAVLDLEEGVWAGGLSFRWAGRLEASERRALASVTRTAPAGTAGNPVPWQNPDAVADAVLAQLGCTLRSGPGGTVMLNDQAPPALAAYQEALRQRLLTRPEYPFARDAEWILTSTPSMGAGTQQLTLTLSPADTPAISQRVAAVYIAGFGQSAPQAEPAQAPPVVPQAEPSALLSALTILSGVETARCTGTAPGCFEARYTLHAPAYVTAFAAYHGTLKAVNCRGPRKREAGEYQYRVSLPERPAAAPRPDAGLYVLASPRRHVIRAIAGRISAATCGSRPGRAPAMQDLVRLVAQHEDELHWQAVHVRRAPDGALETL